MKPLILSFFAVLLGYSFFFDKDDDIKLRHTNQVPSDVNSVVAERSDSVVLYAKKHPNSSEFILRIARPEDFFFAK